MADQPGAARRSSPVRTNSTIGFAIGFGTMIVIGIVTGFLPLTVAAAMVGGVILGLVIIHAVMRYAG